LRVYQRKQLPEPSNAGKTSPICLHQGLIELSTISNRYTAGLFIRQCLALWFWIRLRIYLQSALLFSCFVSFFKNGWSK